MDINISNSTKECLKDEGFTVDEIQREDANSYSVKITDINNDISVWMDVWQESDGSEKYFTWDWNKYIFSHYNEYDMTCENYQNSVPCETISYVMGCVIDEIEVA